MRIGIDATALPARLYGAGNYIVQLACALPSVDKANEYIVFVHPSLASHFVDARLEIVPVSFPSRFVRVAWEQTGLPSLARKYRLDVLHSPHYTMPLLKSCASVVTFHDMTFFLYPQLHLYYKRVFFGAMIPLSARRANAIIAASDSTRADAIRLVGANPAKLVTVPYGIDPSFRAVNDATALAAVREKYQLPDKFILDVGNLEPRKNLVRLVRAFARITQQNQDIYLVLTGTRGWMADPVFATVAELGLNNRVLFPGFIPQSDLPMLYSLARVFIYPSLYEGFGLPVLEAMACGTPVITSNISSMPEIAGNAGLLVNPLDENEMANAINRVLTDTNLRDKLARDGYERSKLFSWERTARETLAIYKRVAA